MVKRNTSKTSSKSKKLPKSLDLNDTNKNAWVWSQYISELPQTKQEIAALKEINKKITKKMDKLNTIKFAGNLKKSENQADIPRSKSSSTVYNKLILGGVTAAAVLAAMVYKENNENYATQKTVNDSSFEQSSVTNHVATRADKFLSPTTTEPLQSIHIAIENIEEANKKLNIPELNEVLHSLSHLENGDLRLALTALRSAYQIDPSPELQAAILNIEKITK